eukprot:gene532-19458_t
MIRAFCSSSRVIFAAVVGLAGNQTSAYAEPEPQKKAKPCKVCSGFGEAFKRTKGGATGVHSAGVGASTGVSHAATPHAPNPELPSSNNSSSTTTAAAAAAATSSATPHHSSPPNSNSTQPQPPSHTAPLAERHGGCPENSETLGRAGWSDTPSVQDAADMQQFLKHFAKFYPCEHCAEHLRSYMVAHPPDVSSSAALAAWMCSTHNEVNARQGKPAFDCSLVGQRWMDGWDDDSCE